MRQPPVDQTANELYSYLSHRMFSRGCCAAPSHPSDQVHLVEADVAYADAAAAPDGRREACKQAAVLQPLELHGCSVWCSAATALCKSEDAKASSEAAARLWQVSNAALRNCGLSLGEKKRSLPPFSVPFGVNINEEDSARSADAVRAFAEMMHHGALLFIAIDGIELPVEVSMDSSLGALQLAFNGVRKKLPLKMVRSVSLKPQKNAKKGAAAPKCLPNGKPHRSPWHVQLELEDNSFCIFAFTGSKVGMEEASFFGSCVLILSEAARFEAVRVDLASHSFPVVGPHDVTPRKARDVTGSAPDHKDGATSPGSDVVTSVPLTATARSEPSVCGDPGGCVLDGDGGEQVVAALIAAGATPVSAGGASAVSEGTSKDPSPRAASRSSVWAPHLPVPPAAGPADPPPTRLAARIDR